MPLNPTHWAFKESKTKYIKKYNNWLTVIQQTIFPQLVYLLKWGYIPPIKWYFSVYNTNNCRGITLCAYGALSNTSLIVIQPGWHVVSVTGCSVWVISFSQSLNPSVSPCVLYTTDVSSLSTCLLYFHLFNYHLLVWMSTSKNQKSMDWPFLIKHWHLVVNLFNSLMKTDFRPSLNVSSVVLRVFQVVMALRWVLFKSNFLL